MWSVIGALALLVFLLCYRVHKLESIMNDQDKLNSSLMRLNNTMSDNIVGINQVLTDLLPSKKEPDNNQHTIH